ncbi:MAG: AMP-binding protein [Lysobacterales bacterium]
MSGAVASSVPATIASSASDSRSRPAVGMHDAAAVAAAYRDGWWVRQTLADAARACLQQDSGRIVIVDGQTRLDMATLHQRASGLAAALQSRYPVGSVVSFMLPNWHEAAVIYLAITLAGMVAHPILPSMRVRELGYQLRDVRSRLIFIPRQHRKHDYVAMMRQLATVLDRLPQVVTVRGAEPGLVALEELSETPQELPTLDPDAVRLVLYTSGTTGAAKAVRHTHNTLHALLRQIAQHWRADPGDAFLVPSPISHIGGSIYAFEAPLLLGTRAVLMERWDPHEALQLARDERCTHICGATPFLQQLLQAAEQADEHLPALKLFVCGGASVPPALIRAAAAHFSNAAVTRVYGSSEVPVTTVGVPDRDRLDQAADSDGEVGIAQVRLAPQPGCADDEGEVRVRGPQMFIGYLHDADTRAAFDEDGYFRTGDLGRWQAEQLLQISGRSKDLIIRNGENISPKEIEDLLVEHPDIAEVAIVGIPDPRTGERACAIVVSKRPSALDVAGLGDYLRQQGVAAFKFPETLEIWPSLPRNATGKVLKHVIRARLCGSPEQEEGA